MPSVKTDNVTEITAVVFRALMFSDMDPRVTCSVFMVYGIVIHVMV